MDYALAKKTDNFCFGLAGYYYQQVTDDEVNGVTVQGNRGRVFAAGPALKYDYRNMALSVKYELETLAKNRPEGKNPWVKFTYAF